MAVFNGAFPILPGKEQESRAFAATCMGERRKGFEEQLTSGGLTRETWALQETPMGSFMLVWFEAPDIEKAFTHLVYFEIHNFVEYHSDKLFFVKSDHIRVYRLTERS